jgi:Cu-processing system permease protein
MRRIIRIVLIDILRNKIVLGYAVVLALLSWTIFNMEDSSHKGVLTMLNMVLLVVPLVSVLFSTIYIYNSAEFIELLLSQPVQRRQIWISLFIGLSVSFILAFIVAAGLPLLLFADFVPALLLLFSGCMVTVIFIAIAFLAAIISRDKAKGIGISILLWLYFSLLFDGLVLFFLFQFSDYPIEKPMVILSATNPLDLARILNLLQIDASAMMGYTGAIFKDYFGTGAGLVISFLVLSLWVILPFSASLRIFKRKDL